MSVWKDLFGTINSYFRIGLSGPRLKNNSGVLEVKNSGDSAFARVKGAAPVDDQDLVTKFYADTLAKPIIVSRQADTSASIPANTATRGFVVVTTPGTGAVIGDILYDDGTAVGTMQILAAIEGRTIAVTDVLTGGTISFDTDSIYIWDTDGTVWVKIGDIGSVTGAIRVIRYAVTNAATQDSTFPIPAASRVLKSRLDVTTPYSGGATVSIGVAGGLSDFMTTSQNNPQASEQYEVDQDTSVVSALAVRTTVGGAPAAGAGVVSIWHVKPQA